MKTRITPRSCSGLIARGFFLLSNNWSHVIIMLAIVLLLAGCKEKYNSPAPNVVTGYLVVEGVINNDGGLTTLSLSRTTNLNNNSNVREKGAFVQVEGSNNTTIVLPESSDGYYTFDNLHLDTSFKYRLNIKTSNNEEYQSDFVAVKNNPPIDSISWVQENGGLQLYINTHDPQNNTRYYQWQYNETWEFHSPFSTTLKYITAPRPSMYAYLGVTYRDAGDPQIAICWQSDASTSLLLGSSAKLSQDIIHLPLGPLIPGGDWRLSVLYSILVKQYAWSEDGYNFLQIMKKNTESLGSVFDAQPSELSGNIHCISNPGLPVIGFFNICTIRQQRIFISNSDLSGWNYRSGCTQSVIENNPDSISKKASGMLPIGVVEGTPFGITTFSASASECVDCTLKGTNVKPTFWP